MTKRKNWKEEILRLLDHQPAWLSSDKIAAMLGIKGRSVKYYISQLNEEYPNLILSCNKGYKLSKIHHSVLVSQNACPQTYEERKSFILKRLLLQDPAHTIFDFTQALYVSSATLMNDISRIRYELIPFDLKIQIRKEAISLIGLDENKKKLYSLLIKQEVNDHLLDVEFIQQFFARVSIEEIKVIIIRHLQEKRYELDEYSLTMIAVHLGIMIEFAMKQEKTGSEWIPENTTHTILPIACNILEELSALYDLHYTNEQVYECSLLILSRAVHENIRTIDAEQISQYVGEKIEKLLFMILGLVKKTYSLDMYRSDFIIRFAFHLQKLELRILHQAQLEGCSIIDFKQKYPLIYSVSVYIAHIINRKYAVVLNETEISYIALHVGVLCEEMKTDQKRLKAVIFCPDHYLSAENMYRKIDRLFHDQLAIDGVYTNLLDIPQKETIDLLLSSRPFQIPLPYRTIEISSMVSCNDEQRISEAIHQLHETNYRRTAEKLLLHYFKKDLFFIEEETWEPKALLHRLCERMRAAGYVDERFETSILEREKISSSCFGKIAIPHPLDNIYAHSAIATLIARRPIPWGENQVQIVIMLSISEKDKQEFSDLFEMITHSINDDAHYHQLLSAANYDDFLRIVLEKNNSLS